LAGVIIILELEQKSGLAAILSQIVSLQLQVGKKSFESIH